MEGFTDQAKKFEIASYYTHGDQDNARKMIAGSYKDLYVIKGKFSSSSVYGAFLIFINTVYMNVVNFYGIVSHSFSVDELKTTRDWKPFEAEIKRILSMSEHDDVLCNHMKEAMTTGINLQFITNMKRLLEQNDQIGINHVFQKFTQDRLGFQNVKVGVDFNQISSLEMELNSVSSRKLSDKDLKLDGAADEKNDLDDIKALDDEKDALSGKDVKLVLNGSLILAPIKGKDISTLAVGDRVKVKIIDKNPKSVSLAKAFNAYEDGKMLPIAGRIVSIKNVPQGGYKIFIIVAKGIFIKIEEDEDRIKILMDDLGLQDGSKDTSKQGINIPLVIILVMIFFALIGVIVFFVK